jgi:Ca-activated chloride channel family protein
LRTAVTILSVRYRGERQEKSMTQGTPNRSRVLAIVAVLLVTVFGVVIGTQIIDGPAEDLPLYISSSTEKSDLLDRLARRFNDKVRLVIGGKTYHPRIHVDGLTSGVAEQALVAGWSSESGRRFTVVKRDRPDEPDMLHEPDVWTPTSSMWAALAISDGARGIPGPAGPVTEPYPVLAHSAVVFALPKDRADALRQALDLRKRPFDWTVLQELAVDDNQGPLRWGTRNTLLEKGRPEWGPFLFAKDNALDSTSALAATITTFQAARAFADKLPGPADGVAIPDGDIPQAVLTNDSFVNFVHRVEAGIPSTGLSHDSAIMMRKLAIEDHEQQGWSSASAVIIQEQLLYRYNTGRLPPLVKEDQDILAKDRKLGSARPNQPLVPFYPAKSGAMMMDHPYIVMDGISAEKAELAKRFLAYLQEPGQAADLSAEGFRDRNGTALPGLLADVPGSDQLDHRPPMRAPSGPGIRSILQTWQSLRKKARVILLMDVSGSMTALDNQPVNRLDAAKRAAIAAVNRSLGPDDQIEVRGFWAARGTPASRPYDPVFPMRPVADKQALDGAIQGLTLHSDTPLYENVRQARRDLQQGWDSTKIQLVIVMTDGADDYLRETSSQLIASLDHDPTRPVPVYFIPFGADNGLAGVLPDLWAIANDTHGAVLDATRDRDGRPKGDTIDIAFGKALSVA